MGCLFDCFRVAGGEPRAGRSRAHLVSSVAPAANLKFAERRGKPSRNALSAVFLREDDGSRAASSGTNHGADRQKVDRELMHEVTSLKNGGVQLETPKEIRKGPESTDPIYQTETHSARLPAFCENLDLMEVLKAEDCQTPSGSHQSSHLPDAMSSSWKGCDASSQHDPQPVSKSIESCRVNNESVIDSVIQLPTLDSCSSKSSPFSTPSEVNAEIQLPATTHAPNLEEVRNENSTRASSQHLYEALNPVEHFKNSEVFKEDPCQPDISDENLKCANNGSLISIELSMSDECSLFQNSDGSASSCNKISDSMNTASADNCVASEATVLDSRKKVTTNSGSDVELPSLSQWLKPPNPRKVIMDETDTSDRVHSAKSSEEDRPIIGMVAAHWKDGEPENFTPKWFDGNGIPNSTNKYKEDQKVSWHAMPFEERLEKALSEEKLLSQRKCSSGNTSQFSGVEGEESDTAASSHLYVTAFT